MLKKVKLEKKTLSVTIPKDIFNFLEQYSKDNNLPIRKLLSLIISEWVSKKQWKKMKV